MSADLAQGTARFRAERETDWLRLEQIVDRVERRSVRALSDEDLFALPALYRATLSSLSVARATSLDRALLDYLEALSLRAYFIVYGTRTDLLAADRAVLRPGLAGGGSRLWPETLASLAMLLCGMLAGYLAGRSGPGLVQRDHGARRGVARGPTASTAALQKYWSIPAIATRCRCSRPFCSRITPRSASFPLPSASPSPCRPPF